MKRVCLHVRRVFRKPEVRWGAHFVKKNLVRTTVLSLVPSAIDDFALHHASISVDEAIHLSVDTFTINLIGAILTFASKL